MLSGPPRLSASIDDKPTAGIIHLGLGAFYRAHGAIYIAEAMAHSRGDWGIIGVNLIRPDQRDLLKPQGFAYTAVELSPTREVSQVINVLNDVLVARENPAAVLQVMASPAIKIVTLTVTEKGYCHEPSSGALNRAHSDIIHDVNHGLPQSAVGFLVRALQMRRAAGVAPFTVLCCDNLPQNGHVVRGVVLELAHLINPGLADWIAQNGAFPSTMVDRIVPATSPEDIVKLADKSGYLDRSPVIHEPFCQWVIEDNFVNEERPDFVAAGAQMVKDVSRFEQMKLRMLNGSHSALAYLGYLAGHDTISDTVADPAFAAYVRQLWAEVMPVVRAPKGFDLQVYAQALMERYANPKIRHRTWQIAMDGSQKLPQRLLGSLEANIAAGKPVPGLCLAVAAWMYYVGGIDQTGQPIDVKDPMAEKLRAISDASTTPADKVAALLSLSEIFPIELAENLKAPVTEAAQILWTQGARQAALRVVT
ncbi:mannitol dehydrogenase family protein [bacterium]|jgi:fructuronate reductase|nr:mannitol dehydrogenase family protein [bacterium]